MLEAIRQGFEIYGLSEHVPRYRVQDLYPEEVVFNGSCSCGLHLTRIAQEDLAVEALTKQFDDFVVEAHRLKTKYADTITLLVGLETEYVSEADLNALDDLLARHSGRIEYIVGSVHHVNETAVDFDRPTYEVALASFAIEEVDILDSAHAQMDAYLSSYFDAQYNLITRFKPEVVGHFDLCRLYEPEVRFADYKNAFDKLKRNVRFAVEYGALFELNAAALRKGWVDAYPAEDVVKVRSHHTISSFTGNS